MRRLSYLLLSALFITTFGQVVAQPAKRTSAWTYLNDRQYEKALDAINEAAKHELTIKDPKTWNFRAMIYHDIAINPDTAVQTLAKDPLTESLESIKKCTEYDIKKKFTEKNKLILRDLALYFFNTGIDHYNKGVKAIGNDSASSYEQFTNALNRFGQYFESVKIMDKDSNYVVYELARYNINYRDIYQYAAVSADQTGRKKRAQHLYEGLVKVQYDGVLTYMNLADIFIDAGNTEQALATLELGKANVKDEKDLKDLTIKELQIYQKAGRLNDLVTKLENALVKDPNNPNLAITLAESYYTISEKLAEDGNKAESDVFLEKAIEVYKNSLTLLKETDGELRFLINNKIGTIYFNRAVDIYNASLDLRDAEKEEKAKTEYMGLFDISLPYLEKSMELKPEDKTVIPLLINIYLRKGNMEKVTELNKLKNK
ncbi:tetratricopeptide repeat protein [Bacteroidota bacterium]